MNKGSANNVFELLNYEENKIIERDSKLQFQDGPALTWELTNFCENYYKESEPFIIDGHAFMLKIQYVSGMLLLKLSSIDMTEMHGSISMSGIPTDFFQSYQFNPSNILSAMFEVEIGSYKVPKTGIASIFEDGVSYLELANISDFDYQEYTEAESTIKIQLYFKIKYIHTAVMSQLAKNFNFYHTDKGIRLLTVEHLSFLYRYDFLEVMSEDQVLVSFVSWFVENHAAVSSEALVGILDNIRWNHITINTLHRCMIQHKVVKEQVDLRRIFKNELERRLRDQLQDRDASTMLVVPQPQKEARRAYVHFLRPETATTLFEFIYSKLLDVDPEPSKQEANNN